MPEFEQTLQELTELFERMDQAYGQAAARHGFVCAGCEDNCCRSRFYHHTLAEYFFLHSGLATLSDIDRRRILGRAADAVAEQKAAEESRRSVPVMCPLNETGRCLLYAYRPMICRLHGIPHRLRRPDGQVQMGPGCTDFDRQCGPSESVFLDRTPWYAALADLERRLRRAQRFEGKLRMTISRMLTSGLCGLPDASVPDRPSDHPRAENDADGRCS